MHLNNIICQNVSTKVYPPIFFEKRTNKYIAGTGIGSALDRNEGTKAFLPQHIPAKTHCMHHLPFIAFA